MAKKVELKERGTNKTMYPLTSINNVIDFPPVDNPNRILRSTGNSEMEWTDLSNIILDTYSYGVSWKPEVADPTLTRVGNLEYHKTLPIQSGMKGCIYNPKEKRVIYWLDEDNWKYKKGGNPNKGETEDLARLDGYDGEVMVYVPEFWIKSWDESNRREVRVSTTEIDNTWEHQPAVYIGAYKDTILNTVPENMGYLSTLEVNTAICVANSETYCRGGNNNSANDALEDIFRRQLGKPRTCIGRPDMRIYERKAGKEILSYKQYKNILYWLWVIEYANFNCQNTFISELNSEGYKQGGMGMGITIISSWDNYNDYYPICPCGYTNEIGNGTGIKDLNIPAFTYTSESVEHTQAAQTLKAIRWRGLENTFGDIWTNVDGIIIDADADNHTPANYNYIYTTDNPNKYGDTANDINNMTMSGLEIHLEGYIKEWDLGSAAEIIPRLNGGNTTQYKCDYHYTGSKNTTLRTLILGGGAGNGGTAGLGYFHSTYGVAASDTDIGFRASCIA